MKKTVVPVIEALLAGSGKSPPVTFEWRLIRRHGRPFLLLPCGPLAARTGLNLYSAQRKRAKIWRKVLPAFFSTPLAGWFEHVRHEADASSEIIQFMAQQAGVPADRPFPLAIKLSEVGHRSRLALLLCDESGRPAKVLKAGLNPAGRAATDREADFLAQLPPDKIGCIRISGRLATPALSIFSTDFFPGASPEDDAGMEHLFHDWLNPAAAVPLETLPLWQELAAAVAADPHRESWRQIESALAGKTIRTTLYHGDFTPWNVRVVNSRNLQAFDWERGSRHGIPGWDWFHFTIQTSILARRYSAERAAAEVEQLIHSARFKKYAAAAGIDEFIQPLVLAYLLHHRWVNQPEEGAAATAELFDLLCAHWLRASAPAPLPAVPAANPEPGSWAAARRQLHAALHQWANLFWEPSLNSSAPASWRKEFHAHWPAVLGTGALLAAIGAAQYDSSPHLMFLPFYILACAVLAWKAGRRLGALAAAIAAVVAPMVVAARDTGFREPEVMLWNIVMRFLMLQMCVLFVDRIHKQRAMVHRRTADADAPANLAESWAVLLACGLFLLAVMALDYVTDPHMIFLPLYLFPCMVVSLVLNLRWGAAAVVVATGAATWVEYFTNKANHYAFAEVSGWNVVMRLAVSLLVLFLIDRIRRENFLFFNGRANGPAPEFRS
jgi:hypothetical protein